ncbi:Gfo/Idh/MocA family protein [Sphingobacterium chuzhouense]|uniref:Gfo/Idh/MocA family oxidoreductase n=1 Tax=Sphingobacterium chuzhouense TaxID=1742264 RepID=A0ABR7XXY8_9SPHI|nr:Gfo/Idh/MocA family oxidoreductase [Sphingobacterium chuzhouense]MBD1423920.1 Gfo/Idh/MocA family oxidoreductase [Sphingobacterium chuzhouense]
MDRRHFIKAGSIVMGAGLLSSELSYANDRNIKKNVRLGVIGVGGRGRRHVAVCLNRQDVDIVAICDIQEDSLARCREQFKKVGQNLPKEYTGGFEAYKHMLDKEKLDAVIIATPWQFHHAQAVDSMKAGVYVGCEVIAGLTLDEHWDIVHVSEKTGVPYMCLENVAYRRDVLAILNMVRQGLFGELVYLTGGYQHDLRGVLFNDGKSSKGEGVEFGPEKGFSEAQWRTQFNIDMDGDLYPTHGLGPVMNFANINHGNRITEVVSYSSKARGLADYVDKKSPGHPNGKIHYKNGDITVSLMNCANGEVLEITHDVHLPRPYSIGLRVQGTNGIWMDVNKGIYIEGKSAKNHQWDKASDWLKEYDHPLWAKYESSAAGASHGGIDWFVVNAFIESVKQQRQTPIDVYDSVTMSALFPLSIQSIKEGNKTLEFPDFTKGKWKTRQPTFALDDSGF